jgi:hypothetical protein
VRRQLIDHDLSQRHRPHRPSRLGRGHYPILSPLPLHSYGAPQEVHVTDLEAERLSDPQAGPRQQHHGSPVALRRRIHKRPHILY